MGNFGLLGDITSAKNRVPPPVTSCHLSKVPHSLPSWGDVIYGWSLRQMILNNLQKSLFSYLPKYFFAQSDKNSRNYTFVLLLRKKNNR